MWSVTEIVLVVLAFREKVYPFTDLSAMTPSGSATNLEIQRLHKLQNSFSQPGQKSFDDAVSPRPYRLVVSSHVAAIRTLECAVLAEKNGRNAPSSKN